MTVPRHVQRMICEAAELRVKLTLLRESIMTNPAFKARPEIDQLLMRNQRKAMGDYLSVLEMRIERGV